MDNVYVDHVSAEDKFKDYVFEMNINILNLLRDIDEKIVSGQNPVRSKRSLSPAVIEMFRFIKPQMIEYITSLENTESETEIESRNNIIVALEVGNRFDYLGPRKMSVKQAKELYEWLSYFCELYGLTKVKAPKRSV